MTDTAVQTFEVGDRVTATYSGQTYTGTVRYRPGSYVLVQFDAANVPPWAYAYVHPSSGERWEGSYDIYPGGAIVLTKVEGNEGNPLNGSVESLRMDLEVARQATIDAKSAHQRDISYIAEALKDKAQENEMCEVFEREVRNIGSGLSSLVSDSFIEEASRQQDRPFTVSFNFTGSATVTAPDADKAQEMVENDPWDYASRYDLDFEVDEVNEDD